MCSAGEQRLLTGREKGERPITVYVCQLGLPFMGQLLLFASLGIPAVFCSDTWHLFAVNWMKSLCRGKGRLGVMVMITMKWRDYGAPPSFISMQKLPSLNGTQLGTEHVQGHLFHKRYFFASIIAPRCLLTHVSQIRYAFNIASQ